MITGRLESGELLFDVIREKFNALADAVARLDKLESASPLLDVIDTGAGKLLCWNGPEIIPPSAEKTQETPESAASVPPGTIIQFAGAIAIAGDMLPPGSPDSCALPTGYLFCDGTNVSRTAYADLFAAIGTVYGAGDGETTFALPDFRGMFLRCYDTGGMNSLTHTGQIGAMGAEQLPNVRGTFQGINPGLAPNTDDATGAFTQGGQGASLPASGTVLGIGNAVGNWSSDPVSLDSGTVSISNSDSNTTVIEYKFNAADGRTFDNGTTIQDYFNENEVMPAQSEIIYLDGGHVRPAHFPVYFLIKT